VPALADAKRSIFTLRGSSREYRVGISTTGQTLVDHLSMESSLAGIWRNFSSRNVAVTFGPGTPPDLFLSQLGMNQDLFDVTNLFADPVQSLDLGSSADGDHLFGYLASFDYSLQALSTDSLRALTNRSTFSASFNDVAGTSPVGWTDTDYANSLLSNDALFSICAIDASSAMCAVDDTDFNYHSHWMAWGAHDLANFELTGRMRGEEINAGLGVTFLSQYPYADSYYRLRRYATVPAFELSGHGPSPLCSDNDTGVNPVAGQWYHFRIQSESDDSSTQFRARIWPEGSMEPLLWLAECSDATENRLTNGTLGLWAGGNPGTGERYWDDLVVMALP
jgi:hypothetical protein